MTAKHAGWVAAALLVGALILTQDYIEQPKRFTPSDNPFIAAQQEKLEQPRSLFPVIAMWVCGILSAAGAVYLGYCEEQEEQPRPEQPEPEKPDET